MHSRNRRLVAPRRPRSFTVCRWFAKPYLSLTTLLLQRQIRSERIGTPAGTIYSGPAEVFDRAKPFRTAQYGTVKIRQGIARIIAMSPGESTVPEHYCSAESRCSNA
jgi:hypothetical protein